MESQEETTSPAEQTGGEGIYTKKERRAKKREERRAKETSVETSRSAKRYFLWGGFIITIGILIGSVVLFGKDTDTPHDNTSVNTLASTLTTNDWIRGNPDAAVTLVEYGDFQCPACGAFYPLVKQLESEFANEVTFSYRHFPLTRAHPNAEPGARAAEAAGKQGMFWEMHDILFERQQEWSLRPSAKGMFLSYAEELGLDVAMFEDDLTANDVENFVKEDIQSGNASRVNATPTFFLNGKQILPNSYDEFRALIRAAIEETNQPLPATSETNESTDTF
ncbi:MAG: hypothetical protein COU90_01320 [Candidatus Ryanbacteria bacterium CG10_big_fil_rev_8_21_14_0_10_43_42]|uniref:Thioredoxin domain-containing protein n=1 Tax=Candidatus Ryanbacteria bacterium CG10_big_fil_rev_8_21_14_0_10_43_42 TaxID=1974864 RepID=A0A2M8KXM2_9BACT|nr:MAG: hypothetical protein COU90_01320 [Candidatus Ryanbacteria bacterium CG10_big_fil_rev_8_21_14_0_10_43_42]